jgi:ABC-type multidrug transport system ATPase subunit
VRRRADEVLERIGLAADAERRVATYSGGMRRRLDLAASLVGRPQVMFLDEPTTGIDPRSRMDVWELIVDLVAQGTTVLLTTQYLEEVDRLADRITVIDHGRIVTEGTADELKARVASAVLEVRTAPQDRERAATVLAAVVGRGADQRPGRHRSADAGTGRHGHPRRRRASAGRRRHRAGGRRAAAAVARRRVPRRDR